MDSLRGFGGGFDPGEVEWCLKRDGAMLSGVMNLKAIIDRCIIMSYVNQKKGARSLGKSF
jgi:hypothetical protein